jgi:putative intracellular protease/amidase
MTGRLRIAIPLFPRFTALDAIGPYEVLAQIPAFDITFVGHAKATPVRLRHPV